MLTNFQKSLEKQPDEKMLRLMWLVPKMIFKDIPYYILPANMPFEAFPELDSHILMVNIC